MPQYMLLLYAPDAADAAEQEARDAQMPIWRDLIEEMTREGALVGQGRLQSLDSATTLRVRDGETQITDGPFATTKEYLGGYFLLECADLDEALRQAARLPVAGFGSVEVRPLMQMPVAAGAERPAA